MKGVVGMKIATNQQRLIELFDADPRNDTAIAEQLHVSKQALSSWRNGVRSPKKTVLIEIARMYNVSLEWLMGFDVPKHGTNLQLFNNKEAVSIPHIVSTSEAQIISGGVDKMTPEDRERALNIMRAAFAAYFKEDDQ